MYLLNNDISEACDVRTGYLQQPVNTHNGAGELHSNIRQSEALTPKRLGLNY